MEYRRLGRTGLKVSHICMGCMTFGWQVDEGGSARLVGRALEAGVNFFDTANVYAEGRSEEFLGKAIKGKRDSLVIATKVRGRVGEGPNDSGLTRKHIMKAVEDSLRRLGTDYIDLYQVHSVDPETPIEETLRALDDLMHQGKVRYVGCSNFAAWQLGKALWVSDKHNLTRFDSVQPRYNLISRQIELELLPLCAEEGIGVIVYNPLAGGLLTGKYSKDVPPPEGTRFALRELYRSRYWHGSSFEAVERLRGIAEGSGRTMTQLALAWVLRNATVTSAIIGATSMTQLEENLAAADLELGDEAMALDSLLDSRE